MRLFFVMGAPKSGTTWLQTIMNAHPQVACFGEGHFVEQIILPMQALLRHYNRKLAVVADAVYAGAPHYAEIGGDDASVLVRQLVLSLIRRAGPHPDALWWGDKTPAYSRHLPELERLFPHGRFINIVRDPRDVVVSALYHAVRAGALPDLADATRRADFVTHALGRWLEHQRYIESAANRLGPRLLQVHYEALIDDPHAELAALYHHLDGIAVTDDIIATAADACSFQTMSGGRAPGETDDSSFFRSGTAGRHAFELTPAELHFIADRLDPEQPAAQP